MSYKYTTKVCDHCGASFQPSAPHRKYCTHLCYSNHTKRPIVDKFWEKVKKTDTCWEWQAARMKRGYGVLTESGKNHSAHRLSWELHFGQVPDGLNVLHRCDNPCCVRPDHLFLGTTQDNTNDKVEKGRQRRGEGIPQSKLTAPDVLAIRASPERGDTLALRYGVSKSLISIIRHRKAWKHI